MFVGHLAVALTTVIWTSGPFGPPPPSVGAIAGAGIALWLFPVWAQWIDRRRERRSPAGGA